MRNKWTLSVIATLLLSVAITLWLVRGAEGAQVGLIVLTLAGVGGACLTLTVLRPQQLGLSPPNVMLSLGIGGMLLGLWWDVAQTPLRMLAALCISSNGLSLLTSMRFHITLLPGMHLLMLIGGVAAIPSLRLLKPECRRLCSLLTQNLLCSVWMLMGMTLGAPLFVQSVRSLNGMALDRMLGGMFTGMAWGMVFSVGLYRLFFILRDRVLRHTTRLTLNPAQSP